mgnify:CR=1 FL=1
MLQCADAGVNAFRRCPPAAVAATDSTHQQIDLRKNIAKLIGSKVVAERIRRAQNPTEARRPFFKGLPLAISPRKIPIIVTAGKTARHSETPKWLREA